MTWSSISRHQRGYDNEWVKRRKRILERDCGLCQVCAKLGKVTIGKQVDHIKPRSKGGTDDDENLQTICNDCHKIKTLQDEGKTMTRRVTIGPDGWPI